MNDTGARSTENLLLVSAPSPDTLVVAVKTTSGETTPRVSSSKIATPPVIFTTLLVKLPTLEVSSTFRPFKLEAVTPLRF